MNRRAALSWLGAVMVSGTGLLMACTVPARPNIGQVASSPVATTPAASAEGTPAPSAATHQPSASASPTIPKTGSPQRAAALFLGYWNAGKYAEMYGLLSKESQAMITQDKFVARYNAIADEAGIVKLTATLAPGQGDAAPVQQFDVLMETALVGTIQQQNAIPLIAESDAWKVQWLPSLIFKELTGDNYIHMFPASKPRGGITDRGGAALAEEGPAVSVDIVPKNSPDVPKTIKDLSAVLLVPPPEIQKALDKIQGHPDWRAPIKTLTPSQMEPLHEKLAAIPGVLLTELKQRTYAHGRLASHIVGYMSEVSGEELQTSWKQGYLEGDRVGRAGIERWGEPTLAGRRGGKLAVVTPQGAQWTVIAEQEAIPGKNIQLTIDWSLQDVAEKALGKLQGAVVVMKVDDGSILAAASNPGFDPNAFVLGMSQADATALFNDPAHPFQNRVTSGLYPTGSVFKTISMALVIEAGIYSPESTFICPGYWDALGIKMGCWKKEGHGKISLKEGLAQSCDVVYYMCGQGADKKGHMVLPEFARGFGLGSPTGILGLLEEKGLVPDPVWKREVLKEDWYPGDPVNLAVGQGSLLATPLQVVTWIAGIANGGTLWTPRIVDKILTPGGGSTDPNPPKAHGKLPASADNLKAVRDAMRQTVAETKDWLGTGSWPFRDFPVPIAAKTGTAQSGKPKPHAWFASYAPADKPEIAVVGVVEFADAEGSYITAPVVRQVYEKYFNVKWPDVVKPENRICVEFENMCPWSGTAPRKVQYGD